MGAGFPTQKFPNQGALARLAGFLEKHQGYIREGTQQVFLEASKIMTKYQPPCGQYLAIDTKPFPIPFIIGTLNQRRFQPMFSFFPIGHDLFKPSIKSLAVVRMVHMAKLMRHHVFDANPWSTN